jgi:hypothetical protein
VLIARAKWPTSMTVSVRSTYPSRCHALAQHVGSWAHVHVGQQAQRQLTGHPAARGMCGMHALTICFSLQQFQHLMLHLQEQHNQQQQ